MRTLSILFVLAAVLGASIAPTVTYAASNLEISGWIPYWRDTEGMAEAKRRMSTFDTVYPFVFEVSADGSIVDRAGLSDRDWQSFIRDAKRKKVKIIPTVVWHSGEQIHNVLSNPVTRALHVEVIASMVARGGYDGVNIDYEGKKAETKDHFSVFLTELKSALGKKMLTCAIEARTPPDSLYRTVPQTIAYANDYEVIGRVCDRIEIMTYDQQRADIKLNDMRRGEPYMPVSDTEWVRKVLDLALRSFPKEKVHLGIATYGYHYEVTVVPEWYRDYVRVSSLTSSEVNTLLKKHKARGSRGKSGEMVATFLSDTSAIPKSVKAPKGTHSGNVVAARALLHANQTGAPVVFNYVAWNDADSVKEKINLAREYGIAGVALFKIDGENDSAVWRVLK